MKINYNNKRFRPVSNTENGETSSDTIFKYRQQNNIVTADYSGGQIVTGHLIGLVDGDGNINMRYHQVNLNGEIMTGKCNSAPKILVDGKIQLIESWEWTSGDFSKGESIIEEI